jgi:hypothetical protein
MPIAGVPSDNTTLVAVLDDLRERGYRADMYVTDEGLIRCGACRALVEPEDMQVDLIRRVEGASDPADMAAAMALVCEDCGAHGTAIVRFGPEASAGDARVLRQLDDQRPS